MLAMREYLVAVVSFRSSDLIRRRFIMTIRKRLFALSLAAMIPTIALADSCKNDCGKVSSVRQEKREGKGSAVGLVGGAVVGGLLGNQVGKGTGNTLATVAG